MTIDERVDPAGFARTYFEAAKADDLEQYYALFADDAVVEDEGRTHHGIAEIRAWRTAVPDVTYTVTDARPTAAGVVAEAEIAGDFPGSPVDLVFEFTEIQDGLIRRLPIHP